MAKIFYSYNHKTILNLYALLAAGAILTILPFSLLPYAGMACLLVGFIAAYIYRYRNRHDDFMRFHTTYAIRTMWWSTLILLIGVFLFGCILFFNDNLTAINALMAQAEKGVIANKADIGVMQAQFIYANKSLIILTGTITLLPCPLYIVARTIKGAAMVKKRAET